MATGAPNPLARHSGSASRAGLRRASDEPLPTDSRQGRLRETTSRQHRTRVQARGRLGSVVGPRRRSHHVRDEILVRRRQCFGRVTLGILVVPHGRADHPDRFRRGVRSDRARQPASGQDGPRRGDVGGARRARFVHPLLVRQERAHSPGPGLARGVVPALARLAERLAEPARASGCQDVSLWRELWPPEESDGHPTVRCDAPNAGGVPSRWTQK